MIGDDGHGLVREGAKGKPKPYLEYLKYLKYQDYLEYLEYAWREGSFTIFAMFHL